MKHDSDREWCTGASSTGAPVHHEQKNALKALASKVLHDLSGAPAKSALGASGASGASGAPNNARTRLLQLAATMGIRAAVVGAIPADELEAIAGQAVLCDGHLDGNGDPLAHSLLTFYLRTLAEQAGAQ